ncbi:hypothetical protein [Paenibacillus hunanensis]|uniref:Uncharacterized protein n=1 Tax=Paenibacillus hunanensis TaxID=539262 RepID=A0ABU1IXD4_9BACL|nr:hypothetical protein [Paenibacillus hunanensis]MCL9662559.1 hypothetical protein [Paenibacillus hunanensis]MDR6243898.1 hypothetical protein [Paenibacillus hunanensis]GGJ16112.1 hypothetical protein GCM10008022_26660 [Paenibacillus hunanensis]
MMNKKYTFATLAMSAVLGLSFAINANGEESKDPYSFAPDQLSATDIVDTSKAAEKEFSPSPINSQGQGIASAAAAPYYVARSDFSGSTAESISESFTDSTKSKRKNIDHIGARTVAYLNKGFVGERSSHQYNENQAAAIVSNIPNTIFGDGETYGHHVFEHAGYTTWYPESYGD